MRKRGSVVDSIQPTIISYPSASLTGENSLDMSKANVGLVAGGRPHFSDETAALLRNRLSAASSVIAVVLLAAFVGNLVSGTTTLWWLRGSILFVTAGSVVVLRSRSGE